MKIKTRNCDYCKKQYEYKSALSKFCSNKCRCSNRYDYNKKTHNENTYNYQKSRALERKLELIRLKGGGCECCGYKRNIAALSFHHKDPKHKSFQLSMRELSGSKWTTILKEVSKCTLLCLNCHAESHNLHLNLNT